VKAHPVVRLDAHLPFVHRVDDQLHSVDDVAKDQLTVVCRANRAAQAGLACYLCSISASLLSVVLPSSGGQKR
jgi:hypothetical protein